MMNMISDGVNIKAIIDFLSRCKENNCNIHNLEIVCNNEKIVKLSVPPYTGNEKMQLYSVSKAFTATAIGILFSDGKLSLEEKIIDIFPEKRPENISEYMMQISVKHLLSMNTGHEKCPLEQLKNSDDFVSDFMKTYVKYQPGTHFTYNNAATYLLSEIVTRITKMNMFDFLNIKLFSTLDIQDVYWDTFPDGCQQGAIGLHASVDDVTKLGQLYLNNGIWQGKRILSEKWIKEATSFVSDTSENGTPDWTAGYGYQIWQNNSEGYRFDGAFGQFCIVLPEKKMVVTIQEEASNAQFSITEAFKMINTLFDESPASMNDFAAYIKEAKVPDSCCVDKAIDVPNNLYYSGNNLYGITLIQFQPENKCLTFRFSNGRQWQKIVAGFGKYEKSSFVLPYFKMKLDAIMELGNCEQNEVFSYYCYNDDKIEIYIKNIESPHADKITFAFRDDMVVMWHRDEEIVFTNIENKDIYYDLQR